MSLNTDLGSETELLTLIARVQGFDYDNAAPSDSMALARALRIIAQDTIKRHEQVRTMQRTLADKIAIAEVAGELAGVIDIIRPTPAKRRWFNPQR
jgi:hypothetical protein